MEIITPREQIGKFLFEKHMDFLTSVPQQRLRDHLGQLCEGEQREKDGLEAATSDKVWIFSGKREMG